MRLIIDGDGSFVAPWVAARIPSMQRNRSFGPCCAFGVVSGDRLIAGVVFHAWHPEHRGIEVSMASDTAKWLTRPIISGIMAYPFAQLDCVRITAITPHRKDATSVSRFLVKFGFRREGLIRKGLIDDDAVVWGLLANEWRTNRFNLHRAVEVRHGKEKRTQPAAAARSVQGRQGAEPVQRRNGAARAETQ